jgi:hypothetical protein
LVGRVTDPLNLIHLFALSQLKGRPRSFLLAEFPAMEITVCEVDIR